jgi:hypothetical protein
MSQGSSNTDLALNLMTPGLGLNTLLSHTGNRDYLGRPRELQLTLRIILQESVRPSGEGECLAECAERDRQSRRTSRGPIPQPGTVPAIDRWVVSAVIAAQR